MGNETSDEKVGVSLGIKFSEKYKHDYVLLSEENKTARLESNAQNNIVGEGSSYRGVCCDYVMKGKGMYKIRFKINRLVSNWMMFGIIEESHKESNYAGRKRYSPYSFLAKTMHGWGGVGYTYYDGKERQGMTILRKVGGIYELTLDLINNKMIIESRNQKYCAHYRIPTPELEKGYPRIERIIPSGKEWRFVVVLEYSSDSCTILGDEVKEYFRPKNVEQGRTDEIERANFLRDHLESVEESSCLSENDLFSVLSTNKNLNTRLFKWMFL